MCERLRMCESGFRVNFIVYSFVCLFNRETSCIAVLNLVMAICLLHRISIAFVRPCVRACMCGFFSLALFFLMKQTAYISKRAHHSSFGCLMHIHA